MSDRNPADELTARLLAEGLLQPSEVRLATVASQMVGKIHGIAFSMTVDDAVNLVVQSEKMLKQARKENNDHQLIAELQLGVRASRAFLKFRRDLERLRG